MSSQPHQLSAPTILVFAYLKGGKCLSVVLICTYFVMNEVEDLFIFFNILKSHFLFCSSFSVNCLFCSYLLPIFLLGCWSLY